MHKELCSEQSWLTSSPMNSWRHRLEKWDRVEAGEQVLSADQSPDDANFTFVHLSFYFSLKIKTYRCFLLINLCRWPTCSGLKPPSKKRHTSRTVCYYITAIYYTLQCKVQQKVYFLTFYLRNNFFRWAITMSSYAWQADTFIPR